MRTKFTLGLRAPEAGGEGGGAGGGAPAGGEGGGGAPAGGNQPWYNDFKDPATKTWVESYKDAYPTPEAMATKALNLEKFLGADKAGRGIVLPKDGAKPEEYVPIFRKLGAPEKPDGYKLDPKLATDPLISKFREHAHKVGMPASHFEATMGFFTEVAKTKATETDAALDAQAEKDMTDLKAEWAGDGEYEKNVELGRRAARTFLPHENAEQLEQTLHKLEGALGTKTMMKLWAAIGGGLGEHSFHDGDGPVNTGITPEGAKAQIAQLKADKDWVTRYTNGGKAEREEFDRLNRIAFGTAAKA